MNLTKKDLDAIKDLMGVTIDESLERKLDEKLKHFPTKEEFFNQMDEVMKELKNIREETTVMGHQVRRNTKRIENVESNLLIKS